MLESKNRNEACSFDGLISRLDMADENLWAWGYNDTNFQNWKAKRKKMKTKKKNPPWRSCRGAVVNESD